MLCLFKLKHDIRVESKVGIARRELETLLGSGVEEVATIPALFKKTPFSLLDDEIIHRMSRLAYLGGVQGFLAEVHDLTELKSIVGRSTYFREVYCLEIGGNGELHRNYGGVARAGEFVDVSPNMQVYRQNLEGGGSLLILIAFPIQTLMEYAGEVLKLPYVTFTKHIEDLGERLAVMEKGVEKGLEELLEHLKRGYRRAPWLGLYKEHVGDYVDWAFSDFRTWGLHFIHKHEGKADPWLARSALNIALPEGKGVVLDPFCGSGTFIADAPLMGVNAVCVDVNPLSTLIANVKCNLHRLDLDEVREAVVAIARRGGSKALKEHSAIKAVIDEVSSGLTRDFLYVMLSRQIGRRGDVYAGFIEDSVYFYLQAYASRKLMEILGVEAMGSCTVICGDVLEVELPQVDAIVTSPPYFDAVDYVTPVSQHLKILGLVESPEVVDARMLGSKSRRALSLRGLEELPPSAREVIRILRFKGRIEKALLILQYLLDMKKALEKFYKALRPGGRAVFVVGRYHHWRVGSMEIEVDGAKIIEDLGETVGFSFEEELQHNISKIDPGDRVKEEAVIVWSKSETIKPAPSRSYVRERTEIKGIKRLLDFLDNTG
jgi:site-specific DNA-methyltransferase (cytosine-N4-specific)